MQSPIISNPVQLTLDLPYNEAMSRDDFIVSEANRHAFEFVSTWPEWPANVALLVGPAGSGKTHLANIWAHEAGAQRHRAKNLTFDTINPWLETGALVLEDVDFHALDEVALFHLVNTVRGGQGFLLMTCEQSLSGWTPALPDLASRLRAAVPVDIGAPDDALMRQIFIKQFTDRQISIEMPVIDYLISRMERSLNSVREMVSRLDEAAFSQGRAITKRLAAEVADF